MGGAGMAKAPGAVSTPIAVTPANKTVNEQVVLNTRSSVFRMDVFGKDIKYWKRMQNLFLDTASTHRNQPASVLWRGGAFAQKSQIIADYNDLP